MPEPTIIENGTNNRSINTRNTRQQASRNSIDKFQHYLNAPKGSQNQGQISNTENSNDYLDGLSSIAKTTLDLIIPTAQADSFDYKKNKVTKENFTALKNAYHPNDHKKTDDQGNVKGEKVAKNAGGKVWENFSKFYEPKEGKEKKDIWENTCAVRMSNAMNHSDLPIPKPSSLPGDIHVLSSNNDGNFIYRAREFGLYMKRTNW